MGNLASPLRPVGSAAQQQHVLTGQESQLPVAAGPPQAPRVCPSDKSLTVNQQPSGQRRHACHRGRRPQAVRQASGQQKNAPLIVSFELIVQVHFLYRRPTLRRVARGLYLGPQAKKQEGRHRDRGDTNSGPRQGTMAACTTLFFLLQRATHVTRQGPSCLSQQRCSTATAEGVGGTARKAQIHSGREFTRSAGGMGQKRRCSPTPAAVAGSPTQRHVRATSAARSQTSRRLLINDATQGRRWYQHRLTETSGQLLQIEPTPNELQPNWPFDPPPPKPQGNTPLGSVQRDPNTALLFGNGRVLVTTPST
ncbi:hypothetical protein SKAU_G00088910 [Synaphobranchus kaupii]|uniref:Uncharacterized protein n=1 Tax=Synaphobranchus kaupii TaxID=118154 RepID=A0A9Q1FX41_SYNKA|nr:hypothetical protein SKAU_G00088910 [Synaphobranchus kaupii]